MKEHYLKALEDRLVLLNAYRTLHMVIPDASPLSGSFFYEMLKITKYVDDKRSSKTRVLSRDSTIIDDISITHTGGKICSENFPLTRYTGCARKKYTTMTNYCEVFAY